MLSNRFYSTANLKKYAPWKLIKDFVGPICFWLGSDLESSRKSANIYKFNENENIHYFWDYTDDIWCRPESYEFLVCFAFF